MTEEHLDTATVTDLDGAGVSVLRLQGELDTHRAAAMRRAFAELAPAALVVIDLCRVSFIDSAGLGALIGGIRRIREADGEVAIAAMRAGVERMLRLTGVDGLAPLVTSVDTAVSMLSVQGARR